MFELRAKMLSTQHNIRLSRWLKNFSQWDGLVVALGGGIVLSGWLLGSDVLKRVLPGLVAMNPVTAIGFIIAGTSLICFWRHSQEQPLLKSGRMLAGVLIVIGGLKLSEYLFGWHFNFDQVLFRNQLQKETGLPNQIAPNTAFNFLLSGFALWFLNSPHDRFSRWTQNLSLALAFISLVPLVGYIYRASYLYSIGSYIPMALHTAALFFLLATGLLLAQTDYGVMALFTSKTPGGAIARRLLPFALGVPVVLGALTIWGEKEKVYPAELGASIIVVGSFAIFTGLIWWNAVLLNRADAKRRQAEENLQQAHDELEARVQERTVKLNEVNEALCLQITELQDAQEKISEQAELLNKAQDAILVLDIQRRIVFWNKGAERLYGWDIENAMGKNADQLLFKDTARPPKGCEQIFQSGHWTGELEQTTRTGQAVTVESRWTPVKDETGKPRCILIINTNITEKKNYEVQLLRAQRMESIGALAGGVAHDLNNALTPVLMGTELLRQSKDEKQRHLLLDTIYSSAKRGTEMVKQILSFARGSRGEAGSVQLSHVIKEMAKIVRDTFPQSISIRVNLGNDLWNTRGDVTELHQVLLNLCVNARDAMPQGGELTLRAENVTLDQKSPPSQADAAPGRYVMLRVVDSGTGIPSDVLPKIFEPFFTTKEPDKGTGLGLSTVASIVKHHHGFVQVHSEMGKGTEFGIYLPAIESTEMTESKPHEIVLPTGHGEMILVMDDEEAVRTLAKTTLENYGYRVLTALNGLQGIARFEEYKDEIKVLVTDTDMPFMDGFSAIDSIQRLRPDISIIIASGAKRGLKDLQRIDTTHLTTLNKPYTVEQILNAVANAINSTARSESVAV
jgi:PAS domain S-box-containing protein